MGQIFFKQFTTPGLYTGYGLRTTIYYLSCTLAVVSILLIQTVACLARLGQSPQQIQQRYGAPIQKSKNGDTLMYKKSPYYITVHFKGGKADALTYFKTNKKGEPTALSSHEMDTLLNVNSGDHDWQPVKGSSTSWSSNDRKASYTKSNFLVISATSHTDDATPKSSDDDSSNAVVHKKAIDESSENKHHSTKSTAKKSKATSEDDDNSSPKHHQSSSHKTKSSEAEDTAKTASKHSTKKIKSTKPTADDSEESSDSASSTKPVKKHHHKTTTKNDSSDQSDDSDTTSSTHKN